jgi:hypothetical protein
VQEAQALVDGIQAQIQVLQQQLDGGSGPIKAYLAAEIRRIREEDLPLAVAALENAHRALQACRIRRGPRPEVLVGDPDVAPATNGAGDGRGDHLALHPAPGLSG